MSGRLRELAERRLPDIDALIDRAQRVRGWLQSATGCACQSIDDCALFSDATLPPAKLSSTLSVTHAGRPVARRVVRLRCSSLPLRQRLAAPISCGRRSKKVEARSSPSPEPSPSSATAPSPLFNLTPNFGRVLAAYGGVFIVGSLLWAMAFDGYRPDRFDITGAAVCLVGVAVIMYAPR